MYAAAWKGSDNPGSREGHALCGHVTCLPLAEIPAAAGGLGEVSALAEGQQHRERKGREGQEASGMLEETIVMCDILWFLHNRSKQLGFCPAQASQCRSLQVTLRLGLRPALMHS